MKRDRVFIVLWCVASYLALYLLHKLNMLIENYVEDIYVIGLRYFSKVGIPFLSYIVMGILIGLLIINMRNITRASKVMLGMYTLYLILKFPLLIITNTARFIYPRWMFLTPNETTTYFGALIIAVFIVDAYKDKLTVLEENS